MRYNLTLLLIISLSTITFGQKEKISSQIFFTDGYAYNFFTGSSTIDMTTTPKALGSGLYDMSGKYGFGLWFLDPSKKNIGIGTGIAYKLNKYRFFKNLLIANDNNFLQIDTFKTHLYDMSFVSRSGSKLVVGKIHVPLFVYLPISNWFGDRRNFFGIGAEIYYDMYLFAYHKVFLFENGSLIKHKTSNWQIKDNFNKHFYGIRIQTKIWNFNVYAERTFVSLFSNKNNEGFENKIGIFMTFDQFLKKIEKNLEDKLTK